MVGKSSDGVLDRLYLEGPGFLYGAFGVVLFDLDVEIFPEVNLGDLRMGVLDSPLRVRPPSTSRHDPAKAEDGLLGASEKLVDLALAESVVIFVALTLDSYPLTGGAPCDKVDANVAPVEVGQRLAFGPFGPTPDLFDLEFGLLKRYARDQLFEPAPLLGLISALGADAGEDLACTRSSFETKVQL